MNNLLGGLGQLLGQVDEPEVPVEEVPSAMDLAMQAAIEKHAAEKAAALGSETADAPPVNMVKTTKSGVFGRRGA